MPPALPPAWPSSSAQDGVTGPEKVGGPTRERFLSREILSFNSITSRFRTLTVSSGPLGTVSSKLQLCRLSDKAGHTSSPLYDWTRGHGERTPGVPKLQKQAKDHQHLQHQRRLRTPEVLPAWEAILETEYSGLHRHVGGMHDAIAPDLWVWDQEGSSSLMHKASLHEKLYSLLCEHWF